jgi:hypothetical protein
MAENKTKPTKVSVKKFIDAVEDEQKRKDSYVLLDLMTKVTKEKPKMWGPTIIGFGSYHYKYESGHEGDSCLTGFSPRKAAFSIYVMCGNNKYQEIFKKLGKYKLGGGGCLYVKRLSDIDMKVLKELVTASVKDTKRKKR